MIARKNVAIFGQNTTIGSFGGFYTTKKFRSQSSVIFTGEVWYLGYVPNSVGGESDIWAEYRQISTFCLFTQILIGHRGIKIHH